MTGDVRGASGTVKLYRERPGSPRELAGSAPLAADGSFTFMDTPSIGPFVYRAVYTDRVTGLPYATLLHDPVGSSPDLSTDARALVWKMLKTELFANCGRLVSTGLARRA